MKFCFTLILITIFTNITNANETIEILRLPLAKESKEYAIYTIETPKKCTFNNVNNSNEVIFNSQKRSFRQFNFLEKIYFGVTKLNSKKDTLNISLSFASNISFIFSYQNCILQRKIVIDDKKYAFDTIDITYRNALGAPVLDYFIISRNGITHKLYQHTLKDHTPIYELKIGPAVSIRTNFRPENEKRFRKSSPMIEPIPAFIFRYGNFFINKDGAGLALYAGNGLTALVAAVREGEPYKREGLRERSRGTMIGPIIKYENFQFYYMKNWIEQEKGSEYKFTYSHEFRPTKDFHVIPRVYIQVWDKKYSDYYTGVDEDESIYNVYRGKSSFNYSAMLRALYHKERIIYLADFGIKFFDKDIYRSPIITKKMELRATLGVLYRAF